MSPSVPPQLRGYEADRHLGSGRHTELWLGRRSGDGVAVGLSVVDTGLLRLTGFAQRLAAVARQVSTLRHPRVVGTVETAAGERSLAVVTEAVDGIPLRALVTPGEPLPSATAMQLVDDVLRAVGAAHAAGIVHCGIDPDRVLVTARGEVRLDGFALARTLALTGGEVGAAARGFASPERLGGSLPDGLGDLWAAAALAHLVLVGTTPVPGAAADIPSLPGLREVLVRAVAADPARRYPSASALRNALTATAAETLGQDWRSGSDLESRATAAITARDQESEPAAPSSSMAAPAPAASEPTPAATVAPLDLSKRPAAPSPAGDAPAAAATAQPPRVPEAHIPAATAPAVNEPPAPSPVTVAVPVGAAAAAVAASAQTSRPARSAPAREAPYPPLRQRRARWPLVLLLVVLVAAGAGGATWLALGRTSPFSSGNQTAAGTGPLTVGGDVAVAVQRGTTPGTDAAACDITYSFTATGSLSGQGNLIYHFEQSNSQQTGDQTIPITNQTSFQLPHQWRFQGHRTGTQTVTFVIVKPPAATGPLRVAKEFDTTC